MSILVVGSVAIDSVQTPFGKALNALGGSATYFSISASFFGKVEIIAAVGEDFPKKYIRLLESRGIGTKGLSVVKGRTFRWKGRYDDDLNTAHTIYTHLNVFKDFRPDVPRRLRNSKCVFLANIDPELQYGVLRQMRRPELVACDSMNFWIANKRKALLRLLRDVDIALFNDAEARQLTGEANLLRSGRSISAMGPKVTVIKRGEHGAACFYKDASFFAPAYPLEHPRDPTGAGDTFAGGMIGYLSSARKIDLTAIRRGVIYGTILASFVVEDFSVKRLLRLSRRDIEKRISHFRELTRF